jgi:predicted RNA-binding protein with RPS1 domain
LKELRVGEVRRGTVSSLSSFGAFVDLGGADGLVHLSELSWNRSVKPRDVLKVRQQVDVYVLGVDHERKRIALSLKRLEPEPWATVESRYYVGQLVEGTITRLANFGAFALVSDEIEGLIHISELSEGRINHPQEVVSEGEKHVMRIIRIDPRRRRMGLSLRRVADPAYADLDWRAELAEAEAALERDEEPSEVEEAAEVVESADVEAPPEPIEVEVLDDGEEASEAEEPTDAQEPAEAESLPGPEDAGEPEDADEASEAEEPTEAEEPAEAEALPEPEDAGEPEEAEEPTEVEEPAEPEALPEHEDAEEPEDAEEASEAEEPAEAEALPEPEGAEDAEAPTGPEAPSETEDDET